MNSLQESATTIQISPCSATQKEHNTIGRPAIGLIGTFKPFAGANIADSEPSPMATVESQFTEETEFGSSALLIGILCAWILLVGYVAICKCIEGQTQE
jgi:hypothetical protein